MTQIWPKRCCCLVKNELKYAGPFGLAAVLCGTVFINRLNREKALDTMKKTVGDILNRNVSCNLGKHRYLLIEDAWEWRRYFECLDLGISGFCLYE